MKRKGKLKKIISKYNIVRVIKETRRYLKYNSILLLFEIISTALAYILPILDVIIFDKGFGKKNLNVIYLCSGAYFGLILIQYFIGIISAKVSIRISSFIEIDLKKRVISFFMNMTANRFSEYDRGRIDTIIKKDLIEFQSIISDSCQSILLNVVQIAVVSFAMIKINVLLGSLMIIYQLFDMLIFFVLNKKMEKLSINLRGKYISQNRVLNDIINHIRDLRLVGAKDFMHQKLIRSMKEKVKQTEVIQVAGVKNNGVSVILNGVMLCGVYIMSGLQIKDGNMTVGMLVAFLSYSSKFSSPVSSLCNNVMSYSQNIAQISEISNLLNEIEKEEKRKKKKYINHVEKIEFRDLNYRYDESRSFVLEHVYAKFEKGNIYFIIGRSGSGKTTLAKLLTGQYDIEVGMIQYDDYDIEELENVEETINWFPQEPIIFQDTIYNNIVLGNEVSEERLEQVCKQSQIYDEIMEMDNKFDTILEEDGHNISGGQKQRIALARLLLHNKDILLLDEATSALDAQTEHMLKNVIREIAKDKIVIIITHSKDFLMKDATVYEVKEKKLFMKQSV